MHAYKHSLLLLAALFLQPIPPAGAIDEADIPVHAPEDTVMAPAPDVREMLTWASTAFTGSRPAGYPPAVQVELRRQDHSTLRFGQSCIDTPLRIGQQAFAHGLGTHANSEIVLHLPPGAKSFQAQAGIDNNLDTGGLRGSVQFSVELAGNEVLRTATLRGSGSAVPVEIALPKGTREIVLKVDSTADGASHDQADWADARIIMEDGTSLWADEDRPPFLAAGLPFSFTYDGVPSSSSLKDWKRTAETKEDGSRVSHTVRWKDPKTDLQVSAVVTVFKHYPAAEWILQFENQGTSETGILENIQTLDAELRTGYSRRATVLHQLTGDVCGERSFLPIETELEAGKTLRLAPAGGRPSNGVFPFFNVQYGDEGLFTAIGWSGQWAASLVRSSAGPTRLQSGQERVHLRLHPGERIRSPRVLVMGWKGDLLAAHARFRRLLLFEYAPKQNGHPLGLPVAMQCFDRYSWNHPEWATEAGQLRACNATRDVGCDAHWLDAAWFDGGFPNGVGNWVCKKQGFPNGLKPLSDACHARGLKFILWFEPERVAPGSQIAREHPEFVFGGTNGGLFKLSEPAARAWLTELLSARIKEYGVDVYRNDFNIDPLEFWRAADAPDRQGMTEIRYVEGHYAMWDELRARHPGLWIDNCASGGRRIDLETISRSVPLWRSDTSCAPGHADWDQVQTCGLGLYLPLFTACSWEPKPYVARSAATAGAICQFDFLNEKFSIKEAHAAQGEVKENQKFWYGDFYPLTRCGTGSEAMTAWQFHREDLHAGMVLAFRRADCPYPVLQTGLRGGKPDSRYRVEFIDEDRVKQERTLSGRDLLSDFEIRLPRKGSSLLIRYKALERP